MQAPLLERLRWWFCENILRHSFSSWRIYNGFYHRDCKVCKRVISEHISRKDE